ncbi:hypothetical protein KRP22_013970 [Phytophthora ramorum]|nr:hypothetical protein KRP22_13798 [Phytophthora ramorum]
MNDSDASEGEFHAAVIPSVEKERFLVRKAGAQDAEAPWPMRHKRDFQESENDTTNTPLQTPNKRAKRKNRKSTIDIRKEEIAKLLKELAGLQSQMELLNTRAMAPHTPDETSGEAVVANRVLRRSIQKQQLEVTRFHALMSEYSLFRRTSGTKTVNSSSSEAEERLVVVTRWVHSRVHHPQFDIPLSGWHEMRENTERWIQTLHHTMLERYCAMV